MVFKIESYDALRASVEDFCGYLTVRKVPQGSIFDCKLVLYELLGNVLKHGNGKAEVRCVIEGNFVEMQISSEGTLALPRHTPCADVYAENGRGLFLVESVCFERAVTADGGILVRIKV